MSDAEEEDYIRKAVEAFKTLSPSGKVPVGVSDISALGAFMVANSVVVLWQAIRAVCPSGCQSVPGAGTRASILGRHLCRRSTLLDQQTRRTEG